MGMPLLRNDTALVTGAAQGIGQAIARAIEEEGGKVLAVDRKDFDLSSPGSALSLVETAIRKLKKISIFVHAASPARKESQTATRVTEQEWREMLEVQLNSGFLIAQALGNHMREKKIRGRMLFVTSLHAQAPRNLPHYSASKAILPEKYGAYMSGSTVVVDGGLALYNWLEAAE
jgi:NAD(P)-dependent dehydrogenase (short-subunit alcohol dehydrogenase family)